MILAPGTEFGPYTVLGALGAGGMGEVYRAKDPRLGREVAIKVLPESVSGDPERLARFQREAQVLASLNHPNIGGIYGLEESQGIRGLVLELVEGTSLADRLKPGALAEADALEIAARIAEGLEAAHERGVVHRDLKPANVQCTPDGAVKILDFGLAKSTDGTQGTTDASLSPTLTANMTQAGVILGTAAYMSPEQARGRPVDVKTDVWAFGCVLYEMLSGRSPFAGETVTDILGAIVHKDPDWDALPPSTSTRVRRVLRRCLARDPRQRYHAIGDVRIDLAEPEETPVVREVHSRPRPGGILLALGMLTVLAGGIMVGRWLLPDSGAFREVRRYSLAVEPIDGTTVVIAPDRRSIIYPGGSPPMLYRRHMDRFENLAMPGTEGAESVILSPDGVWAAFSAGSRIRKVRLDGGAPVTLHDFAPLRVQVSGGSWSEDHVLYLSLWLGSDYSVLYSLPAAGGAPEILIPRDGPDGVPVERLQPQLLPDGRTLLYTAQPGNRFFNAKHSEIRLLDVSSCKETVLLEGAAAGRYLASGHLLAATGQDRLTVTPLDSKFRIIGPTVPLPREIGTFRGGVTALLDATLDGMAVFGMAGERKRGGELVWMDWDGGRTIVASGLEDLESAILSPDGMRVAVLGGDTGQVRSLRVFDLRRRTFTTLTTGDDLVLSPVWAPDGDFLYYLRRSEGDEPGLFKMPLDGSTDPQRIGDPRTIWLKPTSVSPDGLLVACHIWAPDTESDWDIWITSTDGSGSPAGFAAEDANEVWPRFSPDGRWLLFMSDRSGTDQIYIKRFPEEGGLYQVSDSGGSFPVWTPDGKGVLFIAGEPAQLHRVDVDLSGPPEISRPRKLVDLPLDLRVPWWESPISLDPGGDRLLLAVSEREVVRHLAVVENWFSELRELAPSSR